ncbi:hypothetical protein [Streptomyces sp. 5-10]|uniref:hypothetical protein n=1 Tax=Streptomyces sp. 5-10 TaxID=878925 RepID=UPI00168AEED9|nr:hypothetical protein [Streptomyces sp. 5-10]MBD3004651.1 hypothetical protein [Streptomyces sp. 5-10]
MTEEEMGRLARLLVEEAEKSVGERLPLLEKRIAAALDYMKQVDQPNRLTLEHIARYLTGGNDSLLV